MATEKTPAKMERISAYIPPDDITFMVKMAEKTGVSFSEYLRKIIHEERERVMARVRKAKANKKSS